MRRADLQTLDLVVVRAAQGGQGTIAGVLMQGPPQHDAAGHALGQDEVTHEPHAVGVVHVYLSWVQAALRGLLRFVAHRMSCKDRGKGRSIEGERFAAA